MDDVTSRKELAGRGLQAGCQLSPMVALLQHRSTALSSEATIFTICIICVLVVALLRRDGAHLLGHGGACQFRSAFGSAPNVSWPDRIGC